MDSAVAEPVEARDDATHEHGGAPGWRERISFNFFDRAAGFGGIARVEFRPGERIAEGGIQIFVPGGPIATVLAREDTPGGGSSVGRIRLDRIEPLARWRLRCKDTALIFGKGSGSRAGAAAPIDMDLGFEAWTPATGSVARRKAVDDLGFVQVVSSGHLEQAGRYSGRIRVGGRAVSFEGAGSRDRSWGARDLTGHHTARWFAVAFGPTLAFGIHVVSLGERQLRHGWVHADGEQRDVAVVHLETEERGSAVTGFRMIVTDAAADRYELTGETLEVIPVREGGVRTREAMTLFRLGEREALGLAEYVEDA